MCVCVCVYAFACWYSFVLRSWCFLGLFVCVLMSFGVLVGSLTAAENPKNQTVNRSEAPTLVSYMVPEHGPLFGEPL